MNRNAPLLLLLLSLASLNAAAFNLWTDVTENTEWTLGEVAQAGTAVNLRNGEWTYSALAEISRYRFLAASYGGTKVNKTDANLTDTFKVGFRLTYFFDQFTHQLPPQAAFLRNLNVGPSFAISVFSTPRRGTPFLDINYVFGGATQRTTPAPAAPPASSPLNVQPDLDPAI